MSGLPKYLVIEPESTVRLEMELDRPSCEVDVELQNPTPGRSFLVMIGQRGGPFVQRLRLSGKARILFEPRAPGTYELVLSNPSTEPLVLRLRGRQLSTRLEPEGGARPGRRPGRHRARRSRSGRAPAARSVHAPP
jgi:hypothetical protein